MLMLAKTPTSSLTAHELLASRLWHRTRIKVKWLFRKGAPKLSIPGSHLSLAAILPQDLVENILSYFIYDTPTLLACSMTCFSWYIAAVPHLHHSLTTDDKYWPLGDRKYMWPKPLQKSYELGLLTLVKRFRIRLPHGSKFAPRRLNWFNLRYFSALSNLQELGIDYLQVSSFMPTIRKCFGHLSQTLRFLALKEPNGSCRQIVYFIGLFPNLQDLKLHYRRPMDEEENTADAELIPLSVPPLQGCLTLVCFAKDDIVKDMITLFGGLRFRHMDLFGVSCAQLLLDECAETLETLRLYPTDPYVNNNDLLQDFDLSRIKWFRTLETTADSITKADDTASDFLKTILSSVTSPELLDVVIIYQDRDFGGSKPCPVCEPDPACFLHYGFPKDPPTDDALHHFFRGQRLQFGVLREMHSMRDFRLVFSVDVFDCMMPHALQLLERTLQEDEARARLSFLFYEPLVVCERRMIRTRATDFIVGSTRSNVPASAL